MFCSYHHDWCCLSKEGSSDCRALVLREDFAAYFSNNEQPIWFTGQAHSLRARPGGNECESAFETRPRCEGRRFSDPLSVGNHDSSKRLLVLMQNSADPHCVAWP